jgi:hypothetical protein
MLATIKAYIKVSQIDPEIYHRAAYMSKFGNDPPRGTLLEDVHDFEKDGKIQQYAVDYMLKIFQKQVRR